MFRIGIGVIGVTAAAVAIGLLESENWKDVLAGALLAWGVSVIFWAMSTYQQGSEEVFAEIRRDAETDILHMRLNEIAAQVGA